MKHFTAFHPEVEIAGGLILGFIHCMNRGKEERIAILAKNGIVDPQPTGWYPAQSYLNAQKEVEERFGSNTLYLIGLATIETATLPPMNSLAEYFALLNISLQMNVRFRGQVLFDATMGIIADLPNNGNLIVTKFDAQARQAIVVSNLRGAPKLEEGCYMGILRKYKPKDSVWQEVKEDVTQERKSQGDDSSTYIITW